jgi:uncharacterized surface protein with fasciclin (FAS1) repeats
MYTFFSVLRKYTAVALAALLVTGCKHDDLLVPRPNENIRPAADFIRNNYDFKLFYAALEHTGLVTELNGPGPFTVLAITDPGFNAKGIFSTEDIRRLNKDSLRHAMQYHVLKNRRLTTAEIPTNGVDIRYETLAGESVFVSAITLNKDFFIDGARISRPDITLSNGVLHVMNKMMQYYKGKTVQDYLQAQPQYSVFISALKKFGMWDELAQPGPFTIFAPTNEAFLEKGITAQTIEEMNPGSYSGIRFLGCYIMYGKHFFVSDQAVFRYIGGEYTYEYTLRNDNWYVQFGSNMMPSNPNEFFFTPYPELTYFKPNPDIPGLPTRIGLVQQQYDMPRPLVDYDRLCENGLVHQLHGVLLLPADAAN